MPLSQTNLAIKKYGEKLINGSISDQEIKELLATTTFTAAPGYNDPHKPITDKNHSQQQAINDFVITLAPQLAPQVLHDLTHRLISLCQEHGKNTLMRSSTLEKTFLA